MGGGGIGGDANGLPSHFLDGPSTFIGEGCFYRWPLMSAGGGCVCWIC